VALRAKVIAVAVSFMEKSSLAGSWSRCLQTEAPGLSLAGFRVGGTCEGAPKIISCRSE
jgi:hypothetical protein